MIGGAGGFCLKPLQSFYIESLFLNFHMSNVTLISVRRFSTVLMVLILLLGTVMIPQGYSSGERSRAARTLYVDDDGNETFTKIQSAVNAASDGDTVVVRDGVYEENIIIQKEIILRSDNGSDVTTIKAASSTGHGVRLQADYTTVKGFTISGATSGYHSASVYIDKAAYCEIFENNLTSSYHGIYITDSAGYNIITNNSFSNNSNAGLLIHRAARNTISGNTFLGNKYGIYTGSSGSDGDQNLILDNKFTKNNYGLYLGEHSDLNTISNNSFHDNTQAGVFFEGSDSNILSNNWFKNGSILLSDEANENSIDATNTVEGRPIYSYTNAAGITVPNGAGQVIIVNCVNMVVQGQNCSGASPGITVRGSSYITIADNDCLGGSRGIYVTDSGYITLSNNTCGSIYVEGWTHNTRAMEVTYSSFVTIRGNNVSGNVGTGIYLLYVDNGIIENNTCLDNEWINIQTYFSNRCVIRNNTCKGSESGIHHYRSEDGEIYNNNCSFNDKGIILDTSSQNIVRDNNCSNNLYTGIFLDVGNENTVENNNCSGNGDHGIQVYLTEKSEIRKNTCLNNKDYSIYLRLAEDTLLEDNLCSGGYYNILIAESQGSTLTGNTLLAGGISFQGEEVDHWTDHDIDSSNTVNGKAVFYATKEKGSTVPQKMGQVILVACSDMEVTGQNLTLCSIGALLAYSSNITLRDNNCSFNKYGISVTSSSGLVLENNRCNYNSAHGIMFWDSSSSELRENDCSDNKGAGIRVGGENFNNLFSENNCSGNLVGGIHAEDSSRSLFIDNVCDSNGNGIYLGTGSEMNILILNRLTGNDVGLCLKTESKVNRISTNTLQGNSRYGMETLIIPTMPFKVESNYWGHGSGPHHPDTNSGGKGDSVGDKLDFDPWLTEAVDSEEMREQLMGYILDENNRPLKEVTVKLEYQGGSEKGATDDNGFYQITDLPTSKTLELTVNEEGYREFKANLDTQHDPVLNILLKSEFEGSVLYVKEGAEEGGDGSYQRPFATIMDAIDAAEEGTNIRVLDGYYREHLPIHKTVHLIGNGSDTTYIDGGSGENVMLLKAPDISIEGFTIKAVRSSPKGIGIYVMGQNDCRIMDNELSSKFIQAIYVHKSDGTVVSGNSCSNSNCGIYIYDSDGCSVTNNTCEENSLTSNHRDWAGGIRVFRSNYGTILDNKCENNFESGIVLYNSHYNTLERNICNNNDLAGLKCYDSDGTSYQDNHFSGNSQGVYFLQSDNNSLSGNIFQGNDEGLVLYRADNNEVTNNIFKQGYFGVLIQESYFDTLTDNSFTGCSIVIKGNNRAQRGDHNIAASNTVGGKPVHFYSGETGLTVPEGAGQVILTDCSDMTVENQDCSNGSVGITFIHTDNSTLRNNSCRDNNYGISLEASHDNILDNNSCSENRAYGIILWDSDYNTLHGCTLTDNKAGGLRVGGITTGNLISNNEISRNGKDGARFEQASGNLLTGNTIHDNQVGLRFFRGSGENEAHNNSIVDNSEFGALVSDDKTSALDATLNWWGHGSGPYHSRENQGGMGDSVSDSVDFDPWLGRSVKSDNRLYVWGEAPIDGNGSWEQPFRSIQDAIEAAKEGQLIEVWEGLYNENVIIDKSLSLVGNGSQETIIDGQGLDHVVEIKANKVSLSGFWLRNSGNETWDDSAVRGQDVEDVSVEQNRITNSRHGIFFQSCQDLVFRKNSIESCSEHGVMLGTSDDVWVLDNDMEGCHESIYLWNVTNGQVNFNTITGNTEIGIYLDTGFNNNKVAGNSVSGSFTGLFVREGSGNEILNNDFSQNKGFGVILQETFGNTVLNNTISGNEVGIYLVRGSRDNVAHDNWIQGNTEYGVDATNNDGHSFNATHNYWGSDFGPFHPKENPLGQGDAVSGNVAFRPWLNANDTVNEGSDPELPGEEEMNWLFYLGIGFIGLLLFLFAMGMVASGLFRFEVFKLLSSLYTRLSGQDIEEDIREHSIRGRIYQHILENPASSFSDIVNKVAAGNGNTSYHLSILEREGYIRAAANGRRKLFWMRREFPGSREATLSPVQKEILAHLEAHGKLSRKRLLEKTGTSRATLHYNVKHLVKKGMVREEKQGKEKICSLK